MKTELLHYLFGPNIETGIILSGACLILLIAFIWGMIASQGTTKTPKYDNTTEFLRRNR